MNKVAAAETSPFLSVGVFINMTYPPFNDEDRHRACMDGACVEAMTTPRPTMSCHFSRLLKRSLNLRCIEE
jgi:hypothetical protein